MVLSVEYDYILQDKDLDVNSIMCLRVIEGLAQHIHYDEGYYGYLLSLENIWGNSMFES